MCSGLENKAQQKQMLQVQGANSLQDPEQQMEPRNGHRSVKQTCDPHNQSYSQIGFKIGVAPNHPYQ
jgi:hypothetical protein